MSNTLLTLFDTDHCDEYYRAGFWRDDTIYDLVRMHAERTPDRVALRSGQGALTYRTLLIHADAFANDLARRGMITGQRVAVWLPSRAETVIALLACSRNGYVCCPSLHRDHTVDDIIGLLNRMRAAAIVAEDGYGADATKKDLFVQASEIHTLRHVYRLENNAREPRSCYRVVSPSADAAGDAKCEPCSLSRVHVRHDRHAERRDAQRQYTARQCARACGRLDYKRDHRSSIR